jgi:hypothetical protein
MLVHQCDCEFLPCGRHSNAASAPRAEQPVNTAKPVALVPVARSICLVQRCHADGCVTASSASCPTGSTSHGTCYCVRWSSRASAESDNTSRRLEAALVSVHSRLHSACTARMHMAPTLTKEIRTLALATVRPDRGITPHRGRCFAAPSPGIKWCHLVIQNDKVGCSMLLRRSVI